MQPGNVCEIIFKTHILVQKIAIYPYEEFRVSFCLFLLLEFREIIA